MNTAHRRPLPSLESLEAAATLSERERDGFYLKAFLIQDWLGKTVAEATAEYAELKNRRYRVMQTGQAQRGFLQTFGNVPDSDFHELLDSLYRFTEYDHALAGILFRSLVPLSIEQECSGDLAEPRAPDLSRRPREAIVLLRRSLERWCDWIDSVVHLRTHAYVHLFPEATSPIRSQQGRSSIPGTIHSPAFQRGHNFLHERQDLSFETLNGWTDTVRWQRFNHAMNAQADGAWPFQEVDEAVICLWPLVKRYNWTYVDALKVLRDLLRRPEAQPCRDEKVFAGYCATALGLHKLGQGGPAKDNRPAGYDIALRLCPPLRPPSVAGEPPWLDTTSRNGSRPEVPDRSHVLNFEV